MVNGGSAVVCAAPKLYAKISRKMRKNKSLKILT